MELSQVNNNERQGERDVPEHVWGAKKRVVVVKKSILGSSARVTGNKPVLPFRSGIHNKLPGTG